MKNKPVVVVDGTAVVVVVDGSTAVVVVDGRAVEVVTSIVSCIRISRVGP